MKKDAPTGRSKPRSEGLPVSPSIAPALSRLDVPRPQATVDGRVVVLSGLAIALGLVAAVVAQMLGRLIALITNLAFHGQWSLHETAPGGHTLGWAVVLVPVIGALIVGVMARYGSAAIRGHGIPEAMEQVLYNESRIPFRMTFLKPLSSAVAIGTGGPFGAEGPIIATGGALGSLVGQVLPTTAQERKTLLAAGAAAGMAATFGTPMSAVLLAIELLLFEYRPRSLIPVALAAAVASAARMAWVGSAPVFPMTFVNEPGGTALAFYILLGAAMGVVAIFVTRAVYAVEDAFEKLPVHWMWWPAIGAVAVGVCGYFAPRSLGVGYDNITGALDGTLFGGTLLVLVGWKFVSWVIALGSGTSGGTLAPLLTFGGGLGALAAGAVATLLPGAGIEAGVGALVGMAALFAGASRAPLASIVFAFEATRQPLGLLPLLGGCAAAYLVSLLGMRHSIMTEKIARRGARVPSEYTNDVLSQVLVGSVATKQVVSLRGTQSLDEVRRWLASGAPGTTHQGFPVLDEEDRLVGVITRRDLLNDAPDTQVKLLVRRSPVVVYTDSSLREAADQMTLRHVGRLPVVHPDAPHRVVGMVSRSDLIAAQAQRLSHETQVAQGSLPMPPFARPPGPDAHAP